MAIFRDTPDMNSAFDRHVQEGNRSLENGEEFADVKRVSSWSILQQSATEAFRVGTHHGRMSSLNKGFNERIAKIRKYAPHELPKDLQGIGGEGKQVLDTMMASIEGIGAKTRPLTPMDDEKIKRLRETYPELKDLKTDDELKKEFMEQELARRAELQASMNDTGWRAGVAAFVGAAIGYLSDPVNIGSMAAPLGGGVALKAGHAASNFLKVGTAEAAIAATIAAKDRPGEFEKRIELGEDITAGQQALELGIEIGAAGLLGGGIGALLGRLTGRSVGHSGGVADDVVRGSYDNIGNGTQFKDSNIIRDATTYYRVKPDDVPLDTHLRAVQKAADDIANGRAPEVRDILGQEIPPPMQRTDFTPPAQKVLKANEEALTQYEAVKTRYGADTVDDLEIPVSREADDGIDTQSVKQIIREIDQEEKTISLLDACLKGGSDV